MANYKVIRKADGREFLCGRHPADEDAVYAFNSEYGATEGKFTSERPNDKMSAVEGYVMLAQLTLGFGNAQEEPREVPLYPRSTLVGRI